MKLLELGGSRGSFKNRVNRIDWYSSFLAVGGEVKTVFAFGGSWEEKWGRFGWSLSENWVWVLGIWDLNGGKKEDKIGTFWNIRQVGADGVIVGFAVGMDAVNRGLYMRDV